jgi:hypothetical protein
MLKKWALCYIYESAKIEHGKSLRLPVEKVHNGRIQPRCRARRSNVGCNPVLVRLLGVIRFSLTLFQSIRQYLYQ